MQDTQSSMPFNVAGVAKILPFYEDHPSAPGGKYGLAKV
jgi:hypothetical protein